MDIRTILESLKGQDKKRVRRTLIILALVVVDMLFVALPQAGDLLSISRQISAKNLEMSLFSTEMRKLDFYKETLGESNTKFNSQKTRLLLHEGEIPGLLESIAGLARKSGVKIINVKPIPGQDLSKGAENGPCSQVAVAIIARAGYHELGAFAGQIENAGKFMKIADIRIASNKGSVRKHDIE